MTGKAKFWALLIGASLLTGAVLLGIYFVLIA